MTKKKEPSWDTMRKELIEAISKAKKGPVYEMFGLSQEQSSRCERKFLNNIENGDSVQKCMISILNTTDELSEVVYLTYMLTAWVNINIGAFKTS